MLAKLLILVLIIALIWFLFKNKKSSKNTSEKIEMLECKKCGTFISKDSLKNGICQTCLKEEEKNDNYRK